MRRRGRYDMLGRRLLAVLEEGGERKQRILQALAVHWGYNEQTFNTTLARLTKARSVIARRRQGGIHYAAAR